MTERHDLNEKEAALLVAMLDGRRTPTGDGVALYGLQRKNLVQFGPAGWRLTYAGSVLAVETEEEG